MTVEYFYRYNLALIIIWHYFISKFSEYRVLINNETIHRDRTNVSADIITLV